MLKLLDIEDDLSLFGTLKENHIVENYYNSETVEQKAMFTLYKVSVKLMFTLYNKFPKKIVKSLHSVNMSFTQHFIK